MQASLVVGIDLCIGRALSGRRTAREEGKSNADAAADSAAVTACTADPRANRYMNIA
jgi:hypothetical protein